MPNVVAIGTYLPCWGSSLRRVAGDDEDAITMAVEAGRAALTSGAGVERVVLVSRNLPLLESSNAAVLLAGLGLDPELEVDERIGGAPATLDAISSARPRTLIVGVDLEPAGAAAVITADGTSGGLQVRTAARLARSLPVRTRNATGAVHDYGDPRLLHERGLIASLAAAWLDTPAGIAGVDHERTVDLCIGDPAPLPTLGASSSVFPLAAMAETGRTGPLVAAEQASLSGMTVSDGTARVYRQEPPARTAPTGTDNTTGGDIPISLAAYERAFEAKTRWEAGRFSGSDELDFPPRYRVADDGTLATDYEMVPLPRTGTVHAETTVYLPVPGLRTPYTLVIVELDGVDIRALVKVTGVEAGTAAIGDRGRLTLRRIAVRSGVPDYGYMFEPAPTGGAAGVAA